MIGENLILYAPNVHTGGGYALLRALLAALPANRPMHSFLDARVVAQRLLPVGADVTWVRPRVLDRLLTERQLRQRCAVGDTVLCFHGLPPLFKLRGHVVVFAQNRLLFDSSSLQGYPTLTRIRLMGERLWTSTMSRNCDKYIVQSKSMAALVQNRLGNRVATSIFPFTPEVTDTLLTATRSCFHKYDFLYVASGEAHKNHENLLLAWRLLAEAGLNPSLALTVDPLSHPKLSQEIERQRNQFGLNIVSLGKVGSADIPALYKSSSAMIFPSKVESYGLPLIEATRIGLPVLASELDYVRDVIAPAETFDPESPVSIARAVRRFLRNPDPVTPAGTAEEFLAEVLR